MRTLLLSGGLLVVALVAACSSGSGDGAPGASASSGAPGASGPGVAGALLDPVARSGGAVALTPDEKQVIVADEDQEAVFVAPADLADPAAVKVVQTPGPPAQIVALDGVVLVTVRSLPAASSRETLDKIRGPVPTPAGVRALPASNAALRDRPLSPLSDEKLPGKPSARPAQSAAPAKSADPAAPASAKRGTPAAPFDADVARKSQGGLLVAYRPDPAQGLVEIGRLTLAPDAWGIAVTPSGERAVVTSAWSSELAVVDIKDAASMKVVSTFSVAREPRGVVITDDGATAFVSHLVGAPLTRVDGVSAAPSVKPQPLPAARARGPQGVELHAALGYAPILAPDKRTLYVPRHAIGADGIGSWWGGVTVDSLDVTTGEPLQPMRVRGSPAHTSIDMNLMMPPPEWGANPELAPEPIEELVQPRAAVYRKSTDTILVASEGFDAVVEIDALAPDPAMVVVKLRWLGREYAKFGHFPERGGAPTGIVLTRDEKTALVFCRSTFDLARIDLSTDEVTWLKLAEDGLPVDAAYGRRLYYNASSRAVSGGLGCAACHPEGRDDGAVWVEGNLAVFDDVNPRFIGSTMLVKINSTFSSAPSDPPLHARQTPMLAGRVRAPGPYGWRPESKDLLERLTDGFALHREAWGSVESGWFSSGGEQVAKIDYLADFVRSGLLPPPTLDRPLTDEEKRGQEIFEGKAAQCTSCHPPAAGYTDRIAHTLAPLPQRAGLESESGGFKTPSLWFIGGSAPYYHDGSAPTLEALVKNNGTRMGDTSALNEADQKALVAYLRTL
jgi:hypothetical protein